MTTFQITVLEAAKISAELAEVLRHASFENREDGTQDLFEWSDSESFEEDSSAIFDREMNEVAEVEAWLESRLLDFSLSGFQQAWVADLVKNSLENWAWLLADTEGEAERQLLVRRLEILKKFVEA
jgi:hypothetical protein